MTGQDMKAVTGKNPADVELTVLSTGAKKNRKMFNPLRDNDGKVKDALILRRYKPPAKADLSDAWTIPDDRKVNPWDLNEPDPTDNGTMGTIPGPVIECNVGDSVVVHFKNNDQRSTATKGFCFNLPFGGRFCFPDLNIPFAIEKRVHSLHPHGFVFLRTADGAYPLSPADPTQPVAGGPGPDETALWAQVPGFSGTLKKGDRVPPGGTFTYHWNTIGWQTTAGVWLYHDHSICDMENVELGAIGIIVIHNPADTQQEVDIRVQNDPTQLDPALLPGGSPNGVPVEVHCSPFPIRDLPVLPDDLGGLGLAKGDAHHGTGDAATEVLDVALEAARHGGSMHKHGGSAPEFPRLIRRGDLLFELDTKLKFVHRLCVSRYSTPPAKALYLQLFHMLNGITGMAINGRSYLGNTPTMIAGRDTRMRFGVVGMGSDLHTFHIHGHRWILPGPQGNTLANIQTSAQVQPVSQFEDTRIFGPANSFVFTIDGKSGSFMRAGGPGADDALGEWHMHCHVLNHMMMGMMGSLLIVRGGDLAVTLPRGVPCEHEGHDPEEPPPQDTIIVVKNVQFTPNNVSVAAGSQVKFDFQEANHTVTTTTKTGMAQAIEVNNGGGPTDAVPAGQQRTVTIQGMSGDQINYQCGIHGAGMPGKITIS